MIYMQLKKLSYYNETSCWVNKWMHKTEKREYIFLIKNALLASYFCYDPSKFLFLDAQTSLNAGTKECVCL